MSKEINEIENNNECETCKIKFEETVDYKIKSQLGWENNIILYTTHCPKCKILEKKLNEKNIQFQTEDNIEIVTKIANLVQMSTAPILKLEDNRFLDFSGAIKFLNNLK